MKEHLTWITRMFGTEGSEEANADLLRRMKEDGDDLTVPRGIDFNHYFATEELAAAFEKEVRGRGYEKVDRDFSPEKDLWLTSVQVRMAPNLADITLAERALNEIAAPFEGEPDGWGCMEVVPNREK